MSVPRMRPATVLEITGSAPAHRAQALAIASAKQAAPNPLAAPGVIVTATWTAGQSQALPHGLGRTPMSWVMIDCTTGAGAFKRTAWDKSTISLTSTNACTASFWVT